MKLQESIIEQLPQIPYVLDQVGEAFKWAQEELSDGDFNKLLDLVYDVTLFTKSVSDPNFFKTHYVIATILSFLEEPLKNKRFEKFDSASKAVEQTLQALTVDPHKIEDLGCFKAMMLHLIPLANKNMDLFTIGLMEIKHSLIPTLVGIKEAGIKTPITGKDYITVMGYALVMANIRMANLTMSNEAYKIYNEISVMLNNDVNY